MKLNLKNSRLSADNGSRNLYTCLSFLKHGFKLKVYVDGEPVRMVVDADSKNGKVVAHRCDKNFNVKIKFDGSGTRKFIKHGNVEIIAEKNEH